LALYQKNLSGKKKGICQSFKLSSVKKLTIKIYADWPNPLALSNNSDFPSQANRLLGKM
jgi:hypothetical protein